MTMHRNTLCLISWQDLTWRKRSFLGQSYDPVTKTGDYHSYILKHTSIDVRIDYKKELIYSPNIISGCARDRHFLKQGIYYHKRAS